MSARYRIVPTKAGFCGFVATARGVRRSYMPLATEEHLLQQIDKDEPGAVRDDRLMPEVAKELEDYFAGRPVTFDFALDIDDAPPFSRRVWERARRIPRGKTLTYQELAIAVDNPKGARAVGNAMRTNRLAPIIPCHRVVHSGGGLGGYSGPGGVSYKQQLLEMESACLEPS
jgi:methylated-DNA-[protein]-cysteine S-methyltransferase